MTPTLKILLVEDTDFDADLLIRHIKKSGLDFTHKRVWERDNFIEAVAIFNPDIVIADHSLPQFSGIEAFRLLKTINKNIPFILATGSVSERLLTEYTKEGIDDYIMKDNLLRLTKSIDNVVNKKKVEKLHTELSIIHKEIKDSINYAKIIQNALLPNTNILKDHFKNSFIMYEPKDTLSGDFYWFKEKEESIYIAVADCTGHGIPGGLLSMMGFNMLYEIIDSKNIKQPSEVLLKLNNQFKRINNNDSLLKDGMDVAFCSVHLKSYKLMYSGANRPLYIIRDNNIIEYKANKIAIDGNDTGNVEFTNHNIKLQPNDRIILFSDGYIDQFSEETNKKLMTRRFKELLLNTSHLEMNVQEKEIKEFFKNWKGNIEQTDDVLVFAIEIP